MIRIAAVDDSEMAWEIYDAILPAEGMALVHRAETMAEFAYLEDGFKNIDVVWMDGTVDRTDDGYGMTERLLTLYPHLKVILTSFAPDHMRALKVGCAASWAKSWEQRESLIRLTRYTMSDEKGNS